MSASAIQQLYQQGVQFAQAGWACETMGNPMAAGQHYQQALQVFDACGRLSGVQPVDRQYWMGSCQLRLGWLTHAAGNVQWAQGWFQLAKQNMMQACRCDPNNPTYRGVLGAITGAQDKKSGGTFLGLLKKGLGMLPDVIEAFSGKKNDNGGGWLNTLLNLGNGGNGWNGMNGGPGGNWADWLNAGWSGGGGWNGCGGYSY
jgi:hypothetical protein